jgi:hypothetical protein
MNHWLSKLSFPTMYFLMPALQFPELLLLNAARFDGVVDLARTASERAPGTAVHSTRSPAARSGTNHIDPRGHCEYLAHLLGPIPSGQRHPVERCTLLLSSGCGARCRARSRAGTLGLVGEFRVD